MRKQFCLCTLVMVGLLLATGCATSGRFLPLKEFSANLPPQSGSSMQGKSVYVTPFVYANNEERGKSAGKAEEPSAYRYRKMPKDEHASWDSTYKDLRKDFRKSDATRVGFVRNGYGMKMSGVFILNDPGQWLKECLEMELAGRGARTAARPDEADLVVGGTITYLNVDAYMKCWADLIVDVTVTPKAGSATTRTIHTRGQGASNTSSSFEFYQPIRMSEQKLMTILLPEVEKSLAR